MRLFYICSYVRWEVRVLFRITVYVRYRMYKYANTHTTKNPKCKSITRHIFIMTILLRDNILETVSTHKSDITKQTHNNHYHKTQKQRKTTIKKTKRNGRTYRCCKLFESVFSLSDTMSLAVSPLANWRSDISMFN